MTRNIGHGGGFEEQSIELLPAFFALATANICIGGTKLKKAENFLVSAFWNLLKSTSDESEKRSDEESVSQEEIDRFKAGLHKTFGRFFLAQSTPEAFNNALEHLTKGIYLECIEFGPENYRMCSSYYYMGELFKKENEREKAKAFFSKIIQIWRKFILDNDNEQMMQEFDVIYYEEAEQHLRHMLEYFEMEFGPNHLIFADCQFTYGLVCLQIGDQDLQHNGIESIKNAREIFANTLGDFDEQTEKVQQVL
jgi:tetratricopeptide (TPR) repeat protein